MQDLVAEYGGALPASGDLLAWLDDFSAEHWDFRKALGVERHQVTAPSFTPARHDLVLNAAGALGFIESVPPRLTEYDHLLVLGGLARTCLQRAEHAARILADGVAVPDVTGLGSFRPLGDAEQELLPGGAGYEVDALEAGFRKEFAASTSERRSSAGAASFESWTVHRLRGRRDLRLRVLAAPSSEPGVRRANTADTYRFWAREAEVRAGARVLVVTSPIYVPFQHCDAIRTLAVPYDCQVETVGLDVSRATLPQAAGATGADRYLQEIRSAIRSMRRLQADAG
ncbi:hypothetical protein [Actinoplanes awajinensis]|uniref:Uncharacterized protein n=1 Tax=Actinoplanes awajinensis subsp. mycoplanecinus TaxID=135947 RepID=A0A0X3VDF9_9ACTN|nr:hypothetical protein [Actinoplanes awajinensis]KUL41346.1 hypothetical protein ADL15_03565 [Actinoplanes awajinensis subsp. mycoplanecinus]